MFSIAVCCAVASGAATTPPRWHELNATYSYAEYIDHFGNGKAQVGSTSSSPFPLQPPRPAVAMVIQIAHLLSVRVTLIV